MKEKFKKTFLNIATSGIPGNLDSEKIRRVMLVNLYSSVGISFLIILGIVDLFEQKFVLSVSLFCFAAIFISFFFYMRATKRHVIPSHGVVILMLLLAWYLLFSGGSSGTGFLWFFVYPATAFFILGRKRGLVLVAVSVFVSAVVLFSIKEQSSFYKYLYPYTPEIKLRFICAYIAVAILSYVFEATREKSYQLQQLANEKVSLLLDESIKSQEQISAQKAELENINKELEKLSIVASETENAVTIAGVDGIIEWVNTGFTKLYGYTLDEYVAVKGANIIKPETSFIILDQFIECLGSKKPVVFTLQTETKQGKKIWIQTTITPVFDSSKEIRKLILIDSDISDIKEAEEKIKQQNEEIKQQNEEILAQRDTLHETNSELAAANELLTDSIQYALLIQKSILPKEETIKRFNPEAFILFKPKSIVSGDFYWFYGDAEKYIFAVADCTGHGVPGAFMSMIGNTLLNRIVKEEGIFDPATILEKLNSGVILSLNQNTEDSEIQDDGMDATVCLVEKHKGRITVSCANQVAIIISNGVSETIKGSFYAIGGLISYKSKPEFFNSIFDLVYDTNIYLFSDGFSDQFGGEKYFKFGMTRFEKLISSISKLPAAEQKEELERQHELWKSGRNQTDDILVAGLKVKV